MKACIRKTALQLKGLKTKQVVEVGSLNAKIRDRAYHAVECLSTLYLYTDVVGVTSNAKRFIRSAETSCVFSNGNNIPVLMQTWTLSCRNASSDPIITQINKGAPLAGHPFFDASTSSEIRRNWDIVKRDKYFIKPGRQVMVKVGRFFRTPRLVDYNLEAHSPALAYSKLSCLVWCTFEPMPIATETMDEDILVYIPPVKINYIKCRKTTYYIDSDAVPSSTGDFSGIPADAPTGFVYTRYVKKKEDNDLVGPTPPPVTLSSDHEESPMDVWEGL